MNELTRREFLHVAALATTTSATTMSGVINVVGAELNKRKMTIDLTCGNIGVSANQLEAIELAARHGFESVGGDGGYLASLSEDELAELKALLKSKGLVFGAAGLPLEFRQDNIKFEESLKGLPKI